MMESGQRRTLLAVACTLLAVAQLRAAESDCPPGAAPIDRASTGTKTTKVDDTVSYAARDTEGSLVDRRTELRGCVELHYQGHLIRTDAASFDAQSHSARMLGRFTFEDANVRVDGKSGSFDPEHGADFQGTTFQLMQQPGHGEAESMTRKADGAIELGQVTYTTCKDCPADWQIRARHITLNTEQLRGLATGARVEFKGVPILYVPAISFPLSDQRQTGLLFPTFGNSSRNGASFAVPWYWNIAPNEDLTLTPTLYTRRGIDLGTEFRLLQRRSEVELNLNFLPNDHVTGDTRSFQRLRAEWRMPDGWRVRVEGENASDAHYLEDFAQGTQASSAPFLARRIDTSYRSDDLRFRATLLQYQTLDTTLAEAARPYAVLPRLALNMRHDFFSTLRAAVDSEVSGFARGDPTGWRADVSPALSWQFARPGVYLRPTLQWDARAYRLSGTAAGAESNPQVSVPIFSLDTGLQLERASQSDTRRVVLEPRLLYVYIPYRDQSQLPVFDSGLPDPNFVSLYRINRYVGGDRIGDSNRVAVGITGHLYGSGNGRQYLSATLGQAFNLSTPRVTLPGETPDTRSRSDLIADIDVRVHEYWTARFNAAWNTNVSEAQKLQVALQYQKDNKQVVNLGYRFDRGTVEQVDASAAWPVAKRWELYARGVYSIRDQRSIENFAGLRFRGDCWGIRAVVRRAVSSRTGERDTGIYLQIELSGLSSVGTGADTFLQQSIQGYSAADRHR